MNTVGPRMAPLLIVLAVALTLSFVTPAAGQQPLPEVSLTEVATGLSSPTSVTHAGDGSGRLFVTEQSGTIVVLSGSPLQQAAFLDISGRVLAGGERGLLSVAFPPDYSDSRLFYVNYTRRPDGATVVARYRLLAGSETQADPASEEVILTIDQPFANHNGGQLAFGPDGFLYIGMGDGGSAGDPQNRAQNPDTLLGKLLRIDVDPALETAYAVPPDNPFVGLEGHRPEIWALGLRNPWRFSFDRQTGDLYIADVGQSAREEINFQPADSSGGENYGWRYMEGTLCYEPPDCAGMPEGLVLPVHDYGRSEGGSVTGGYVYRGVRHPALRGVYIYGDYLTGNIWGLRRVDGAWENSLLLESNLRISSFGEDEAGDLYVTDIIGGDIHRLAAASVRAYLPLVSRP